MVFGAAIAGLIGFSVNRVVSKFSQAYLRRAEGREQDHKTHINLSP